jgi:RNA polymerase primary sigma factor
LVVAANISSQTVTDVPFAGGMDSLALLLRDLPRGPLLTVEQEQALARRIKGEDVLVPPPGNSRPSVREALDRMVEQNMRLVIAVARSYRGRGVAIEDLIQEGALALRHAAELFDASHGNRFSTYAIWWVREAMVHALQDGRPVNLPEKVIGQISRISRAEQDLRGQLGRDPTSQEIADVVGLSAKRIDESRQLASQPISIDAKREDDDRSLDNLLPEPGPSPHILAERKALCGEIRDALAQLSPEERKVLALRYGIGHPRAYSPQEIEGLVGLSKHRAQRVEMQALARLRASQAMRSLRTYVQ